MDAALSRFDPLPRIISLDDFDRGFCGFTQLVGNYEGSFDTMLPAYAENTAPMLSTLPMFDGGSHNAMDGTYCLRVQTRPRAGARATNRGPPVCLTARDVPILTGDRPPAD